MHTGLSPGTISPLDRLCLVGASGMGALSFESENPKSVTNLPTDLDESDHEIKATLDASDIYLDKLLSLCGSSAGVCPKVCIRIDKEDWLIKFSFIFDPKDISAIEYAYHLIAVESGLTVTDARLFPSRTGLGLVSNVLIG